MGKMPNDKYDIQELLQRDVYVNDKKVGTIVGERHHPNEARVRSMRIQVDAGVADEFMRKPAELAPLPKELVHSIRTDGTVKLSKSMRELQRRWRDTVRIDEKLYAPDEMLDRAVLDNQGREIGVITDLFKVKRTYKGVIVQARVGVQKEFGVEAQLRESQSPPFLEHVSASTKSCSPAPSTRSSLCLPTSPSTRWSDEERVSSKHRRPSDHCATPSLL